jgi:hypothetical protein
VYVYAPSGIGAMKALRPSKTSTQPAQKRWHPAEGIVTHPPTPAKADPLVSMEAIDPLMRINGARAPHLPLSFHGEVPDPTVPGLEPHPFPSGGSLPEL